MSTRQIAEDLAFLDRYLDPLPLNWTPSCRQNTTANNDLDINKAFVKEQEEACGGAEVDGEERFVWRPTRTLPLNATTRHWEQNQSKQGVVDVSAHGRQIRGYSKKKQLSLNTNNNESQQSSSSGAATTAPRLTQVPTALQLASHFPSEANNEAAAEERETSQLHPQS
jgi:hypothetical protein